MDSESQSLLCLYSKSVCVCIVWTIIPGIFTYRKCFWSHSRYRTATILQGHHYNKIICNISTNNQFYFLRNTTSILMSSDNRGDGIADILFGMVFDLRTSFDFINLFCREYSNVIPHCVGVVAFIFFFFFCFPYHIIDELRPLK